MTKPNTFHYKTNKPENDGLFLERFFGILFQDSISTIHRRSSGHFALITQQLGMAIRPRPDLDPTRVGQVWVQKIRPESGLGWV